MSSLLTIMIPQTRGKRFSLRSQAELHGFKSIQPLSGNGYWALQQPNSQLPRGSSLQKQRGWYRQLEYDGREASKSKPRCPYGIPELKRKLTLGCIPGPVFKTKAQREQRSCLEAHSICNGSCKLSTWQDLDHKDDHLLSFPVI